MADWTTISSLTTGAGTLVLAIATFSSVRSGNRSARTAERALQVGLRPVLFPSRMDDPSQKIKWGDGHWAHVDGGRATVEVAGTAVYLAMSLRNVGSGIAVLHGWRGSPVAPVAGEVAPDPARFRAQTRDLYVPAGDTGFWQAALRDDDEPERSELVTAIDQRRDLTVDLLYGDHEGGQRTISRFSLNPGPVEEAVWLCSVVRHWSLDRRDPRPQR